MIAIESLRGCCIGVLTIRQDEHDAVRSRLTDVGTTKGRRLYQCGTVPSKRGDDVRICLYRIAEQGNGPAQHAAQDMIADLDPKLVIVVGIGGGFPDSEVTLGDVVLAIRLADMRVRAERDAAPPQYEMRGEPASKALADILANLPDSAIEGWAEPKSLKADRPSAPLDEDRFEGPPGWVAKLRAGLEALFHGPKRRNRPLKHIGTIGSSDALVRAPEFAAQWLESSRKVQAIEMEAAGVFEAANTVDAIYPVLVVRGLSDIVGYRRDPGWTDYACHSAASFAIALIRSGYLAPIGPLRLHVPSVAPPSDAPPEVRIPKGVGSLLLSREFEPVGGDKAIRIWVKEVLHQGPFSIVFQDEDGLTQAVAKLNREEKLSMELRDARIHTIQELERLQYLRRLLTCLALIVLGGHLSDWDVDRSRFADFIGKVLKVIASRGTEPDPEDYLVCHVQSSGAFFANCTLFLAPDEQKELRSAIGEHPSDGVAPAYLLEGPSRPARLIPFHFRFERVLPLMVFNWLCGVAGNKGIQEVVDEARSAFAIERTTFVVEKRLDRD